MESQEFEKKKFEYQMAQEMLRHYDALNWQIGAVLIAAVLILTGFAANKDIIQIARESCEIRWTLNFGIPILSLFVLGIWFLWFRRHRSLYNFRNEVLQRLELQLGMFHFLRVAESEIDDTKKNTFQLTFDSARKAAGHDSPTFTPFFDPGPLSWPSGYLLAMWLAFGLPIAQFVLLLLLYRV